MSDQPDCVMMASDDEEAISSRTRSKASNSLRRDSTSPKINTSKSHKGLEEKFPEVAEIFKHNKDSRTEIMKWRKNGSNNKNIIYINSESITAEKLYDLCDKDVWLSSDHINAYFSYLSTKFHHVFSLPSFFYTKLTTTGKYEYSSVVRWTKKTEVFHKEIIFVPIILDESHWILATIFMRNRTIAILDSLGILTNENAIGIGRNLIRWLNDEYRSKSKVCEEDEYKSIQSIRKSTVIGETDSNGQVCFMLDIMFRKEKPPQEDGCSCGVFVSMFAKLMAENIKRDIIIGIVKYQEANKKFRRVMCTDLWEYAKENKQL